MIKTMDDLGRIVIPKEYRQALDIKPRDEIDVTIHSDGIRIQKAALGCVFCGTGVDLVRIGNKCACRTCIERLHRADEGEVLYGVGS